MTVCDTGFLSCRAIHPGSRPFPNERPPPAGQQGQPSLPLRSRRLVILRKLAFATTLPQALLNLTHSGRGKLMRDIRSDLEERANIIQEQLRASYAHFESVVQQLQRERDARIADLTDTLTMIDKLMQLSSVLWTKS